MFWATLAIVAALSDSEGCIDAALLARELQARAPETNVDVAVASGPGDLELTIRIELNPPLWASARTLVVQREECADLPRAIAVMASALAQEAQQRRAAPALESADPAPEAVPTDAVPSDAVPIEPVASEAAPIEPGPTVDPERQILTVDADLVVTPARPPVVESFSLRGAARLGVLGAIHDGVRGAMALSAGPALHWGDWQGALHGRVGVVAPVELGSTYATRASLSLSPEVALAVDVGPAQLVPRIGASLGAEVAFRADSKRTAVTPLLDVVAGAEFRLGRAAVGLESRLPVIRTTLLSGPLAVEAPWFWLGLTAGYDL